MIKTNKMKTTLFIILVISIACLFSSSVYAQVISCDLDPYAHSSTSIINGVILDQNNDIIVVGSTCSPQFPNRSAFQPYGAGNYDAFITRISSDGSSLITSTYLGGSGEDRAQSCGVDLSGAVSVTGYTDSDNFPLKNPYQSYRGGRTDAFIVKLTSSSSGLIFSTYLGGDSDEAGFDLILNTGGDIFLSGETSSSNFPTKNSYQASRSSLDQDLFLARFSSSGSNLIFSTYLGGDSIDFGGSIDLGPEDTIFMTGTTWSDNFPTSNCYQKIRQGKYDVFVSRFASTGSVLLYSTYLGGKGFDFGNDIIVDSDGCAYVVGSTIFDEFPLVTPLLEFEDEEGDAFLIKLSSSGSKLLFSTRYGAASREYGEAVALDSSGQVYLLGATASSGFPLRNPFQSSVSGETDLFVAKINIQGREVVYSTYLGGDEVERPKGLVVDKDGSAVLVGYTFSYNFPVKFPLQRTLPGGGAGFLSRLTSSGTTLCFSTYLGGVPPLMEKSRWRRGMTNKLSKP